MKFEHIKDIIPLFFTVALTSSYVSGYGYYLHYGIDISPYISIADITFVFSKWIILSALIISVYVDFLLRISNNNPIKRNWWDIPIGKSNIKRRAIPIGLITLILIIACIFNTTIATGALAIFGIVAGITILIIPACLALILGFYQHIAREPSTITWGAMVFSALFLLFIVPFMVGDFMAYKNKANQKIIVEFTNGKILNSEDDKNLIYIGKTADYFFTRDTTNRVSTAYRMDKVVSFTFK